MVQLCVHPEPAPDQIAALKNALFDPAGPVPVFAADFRLRQYWINGQSVPEAEALAHSVVPDSAWRDNGIWIEAGTDLTWPAQALGTPDFSGGIRIEIEASQVHADRDFPTLVAMGDNTGNVIDIHSFGDGAGLRARCRINGVNTVFLSRPYPNGEMFRAVLEMEPDAARFSVDGGSTPIVPTTNMPNFATMHCGKRNDDTNFWDGLIELVKISHS